MTKRKRSNIQNTLLVILAAIVAVLVVLLVLYGLGNTTVREWAMKAGIVEGRLTLFDTAWVWERTDLLDGTVVAPRDNSFVLSFISAEERFTSTTDCNTVMGGYLVSGDSLRFGALASTLMFCQNSMEDVYTQELSMVNSYRIEGGKLYLNLDREFGTMVFGRK